MNRRDHTWSFNCWVRRRCFFGSIDDPTSNVLAELGIGAQAVFTPGTSWDFGQLILPRATPITSAVGLKVDYAYPGQGQQMRPEFVRIVIMPEPPAAILALAADLRLPIFSARCWCYTKRRRARHLGR